MRRVCQNCKQEYKPEEWEAKLLELDKFPDAQIFKANPKGCDKCGEIGYKGRVGTHELLIVNEALRNGINAGQNTDELKQTAVNEAGMVSLHKDSMEKCRLGITDVDEALRVVRPDN
jgi:type II secretory ATPase GspE/PulE/Tfp pilus assembly ATPase PilB-like protein